MSSLHLLHTSLFHQTASQDHNLGLGVGRVLVDEGSAALAAVLAVSVARHEHASTTLGVSALATQASDLAVLVHLVVLENRQLGLLLLVLVLLGGGVVLLLPLPGATTQTQHEMEGRLLLDVVVAESATVLQLLASEDQTLLVGWDALLVLDLGLDILDSVGGFDLERDGLTREGFHEDLHFDPTFLPYR